MLETAWQSSVDCLCLCGHLCSKE
jgi:ankyrin repeat protein